MRLRIAITQGDTNGIGLEVILKTFANPTMLELCTPIVYANPSIVEKHKEACDVLLNLYTIDDASQAMPTAVNLVPVDDLDVPVDFGKPTKEAGRQALLSLEAAMRDLKEGKVEALVTGPINKNTIQCDEFHFPGHTEYIEACAGEGGQALMILLNQSIRIALVTTHLPLAHIAEAITQKAVLDKVKSFNHSLRRDFGISSPRIAVLGLNPHAGDGGVLGSEEQDVIIPAIKAANLLGIRAFGPYAADGFFGAGSYDHFDGILAMYHDQGLAPFKTLAMDDGVNFTAGLPVVRTSPDHGTAYDIAGKGTADENSFRQAVYTAIDVVRNRARYDEATRNPLEKLYHERREDEGHNFRQSEKHES